MHECNFCRNANWYKLDQGTCKRDTLAKIPQERDRFLLDIDKQWTTGSGSYQHAVCIRYSSFEHNCFMIDSEIPGVYCMQEEDWQNIASNIKLLHLGKSGLPPMWIQGLLLTLGDRHRKHLGQSASLQYSSEGLVLLQAPLQGMLCHFGQESLRSGGSQRWEASLRKICRCQGRRTVDLL